MVHDSTRKIIRITSFFHLIFVGALLIPLTVMAGSETLSCTDAHRQIEQTQKTLHPLKQHQELLQQEVRTIYQELFACQTGIPLTQAQQEYCTHLQEEGPKQFQAMVEVITLSHQTSQQLAHQAHQIQLTCPGMAEVTSPKISRLEHS